MENDNAEIVLHVQNVFAGYGEIEILRGISLTIRKGQIVTIIGANGAGKSTLLKTIFGLVKPTAGSITHEGINIAGWDPGAILRRGISFSPGGRANFPAMTVQENLEMGAFVRQDTSNVRAEIDRLCERFEILREKRHTAIGNLSGGQQQVVELAMALMMKPTMMLIDEPTIGLAPLIIDEIFHMIQEINASGTTIVLVEQNARRALDISDYGFVLELGQMRYEGSARELSQFEEVYRAYLGER